MTQTKTLTLHQRSINWLVQYILQSPNQELNYRHVMKVLSSQKEYFVRCYFLDNKYMYGSFVKEAQSEAAK